MATVAPPAERSLTVAGTTYPVRLPHRRDPRLHLAATITSIQVLGQAFLGWELSIAQILVCLLTCAVLEVAIVMREQRVIAWPASALLTGNGVALVLRVNGTEHGDWWSMQGWYVFAATSALALLSKHLIRHAGRPVVNPSNLGLVVVFVVLGTDLVNPLDFWWGPMSASMVAVYAILAAGAVAVTRRLGLLPMSLAFWAVFASSLGVLAASGHCFSARWSVQPVCGADFWWVVVTSPEVLVFMLFMITDPMTSPRERRPRVVFGASVGLASALLLAPMQTEFGAKVAVLAGLVVVCALRPLLAWAGARRGAAAPAEAPVLAQPGRSGWRPRHLVATAGVVAVAVPALLLLGTPAREPALPVAAAVDPGLLEQRPDVDVPEGAVPPVQVSGEVRSVIGDRAGRDADQMARHLVADLLIEADALRSGDADLAATALAGPRLAEARVAVAAGDARPAIVDCDGMVVVMVRDPGDPQAIPRFGIRATGTRTVGGRSAPLDRVFVLQEVAGVWLLTDELAPART
jgi:Na+-translocating ferredoxin:NAD+ oxidoreductase RnfD subunit